MINNQGLIGYYYKRYKAPPGMDNDDWMSQIRLVYCRACIAHDESRGTLATIMDRMVKHEWCLIRDMFMSKIRGQGVRPVSLGELVDENGVGYEAQYNDQGQEYVDAVCELRVVSKMISKRDMKMFKMRSEGMRGSDIAKKFRFRWKSWPNRIMQVTTNRILRARGMR